MDPQTAKLEAHAGQRHWIDGLLVITEIALDFYVGICAGAIVGWLSGLCAGHVYVRHCQPVYASAYSSLSEVSEWILKPGMLADKGAHIGATVSTIIVFAIWIRVLLQKRRVAHKS